MVALMVVLGFLVPALSPHDPSIGGSNPALSAPSQTHWFGTDHLGRDVFTRAFAAVRIDVALSAITVTIPLLIGTVVGSIIGTARNRWAPRAGDTLIESINAFPTLIIVIGLVAVLGRGARGIVIGLLLTAWARYAKVARGRALILRSMEYLDVTRVLGYSRRRVLLRHVLPNVFPDTLAYAISDFVVIILAIAGLSFLGAGVQPPTPEWGAMMSDGRLYMSIAWWIVVFPGLLLMWTAVGVALIANQAKTFERHS